MQKQELTEMESAVLLYLKNELKRIANRNFIFTMYGVNARDIIKFIERPEMCGTWSLSDVYQVDRAIQKTYENYIFPFPKIEEQTEEDRILSRLLRKNKFFAFGTSNFFKSDIAVEDVIEYMERSENIYQWNAFFVMRIQQETKRVKDFLL